MKKHIVCFGDSNTHGYCADPNDTEDHTDRFTEDERWPCLLQEALGEDYLVLEEGLSGRTTVFRDPLHECMSGRGGELIISECERVLRDEYSELAEKIHLALPDEKFRRVGQSAAAASLPEIKK